MDVARLVVPQPGGVKNVALARFPFRIGRHHENDLVLGEADVSRQHAEIQKDGERYFISYTNSRFGTYLNGTRVVREALAHGDHVQLGSPQHPALEFQLVSAEMSTGQIEIARNESRTLGNEEAERASRAAQSGVGLEDDKRSRGPLDLIGQALRAMVEGHVLEEVLAIVVDHAIELSGAERGFVMLPGAGGELDVRMARGRHHQTLPGRDFQLSRTIPKQVYESGTLTFENEVPETRHTQFDLKIRSILCAPLPRVRSTGHEPGATEQVEGSAPRAMGVLYVDSAGLGRHESDELQATFTQLANEAAVAIENARLVRASEEKNRMERELAVAAEIQMALLPPPQLARGQITLAGTTVPCRAIGGYFYEYLELPDGRLGFALCDVSGKGPGAALLAAAIQGILAATAEADPEPSISMARLNRTLLRRSIDRRFATIAYGLIDDVGRLRLTSAGHNPAYLLSAAGGFKVLEKGGLMVGAFPGLVYEQDDMALEPGDMLLLYSDGVTEAEDEAGGQFEQERLEACLKDAGRLTPVELVNHVLDTVRNFAGERAQADDITILVVRYAGPAGVEVAGATGA